MIQYETLSRVTMTNSQRMRQLLDLCVALDECGNYNSYFEKSRINILDIAVTKNGYHPVLIWRKVFHVENVDEFEGCCKSLIELFEGDK